MRIHELLDQSFTQYIEELTEQFELTELSFKPYTANKSPQLKRAMQVARKVTSRRGHSGNRVKTLARRVIRAPARPAAVRKQPQIAKPAPAAAAYNPIKYRKELVLPRKQTLQQQVPATPQTNQRPTPAPVAPADTKTVMPKSLSTPTQGTHGLANLGADAWRILPPDKKPGMPPWEISK